jgi:hypothetical protein
MSAMVIEALADSEAALLDQVVTLTIQRDSYRALSQQSLHVLHVVTRDRDRIQDLYYALLNALRAEGRAA